MEHIICVRNIIKVEGKNKFGNEPGDTTFLSTPDDVEIDPSQSISRTKWVKAIIEDATHSTNEATGKPTGDILVFIHGYNSGQEIILKRHKKLKSDLKQTGYMGVVISFDWPSAQHALNYLEDRDDAKDTSRRLRDDCISLFSSQQVQGCEINVHLLGHSTGAYVIRQAFTDADEKTIIRDKPWTVSQIALIAGDISAKSVRKVDHRSKSLYRHCVRLTNYQNPYDSILKLSDTKRLGLSPRVGRVGLPNDAHEKAVNVNCGPYFKNLNEEDSEYYGSFKHSWHIGDKVFTKDLFYTLQGDIDRWHIPTRNLQNSELILINE